MPGGLTGHLKHEPGHIARKGTSDTSNRPLADENFARRGRQRCGDVPRSADLGTTFNFEAAVRPECTELGEEVALTVYNGDDVIETTMLLWDPGRRISRINIGPLLQYESSLVPSSETFSLLDFWLFAVYSYSRIEGERSHNIFGLFNITSDYGELTELED